MAGKLMVGKFNYPGLLRRGRLKHKFSNQEMHDYVLLGFCQRLRFQGLRLYSVVILINKSIDYIGFKCLCLFKSCHF